MMKYRLECPFGLLASLLVALFALGNSLDASAQKVELRVEMPRGQRNIGVGDEFHLVYTVSDISAAPERPNVPGSKLLYFDRTGQSSRFQSINGRTSQSVSYTYTATLRAQKEGSYSFGPVTVGNVRSNTVHYAIGKAAPAPSSSPSPGSSSSAISGQDPNSASAPKFIGKGDGHLFLKANVSKTSAYEQEALVYTVKLYTTYSAVKFIGAASAPKFEGFVIEESKFRDTQFNYETYNGKTYATAVIARYIIFPQMAGNLKVLGNTYTVSVDQREYFSDPFWGSMSYSTPLQLNVTPNDLVVNVRALPSPQPADFSGGVGQFSLSVTLPSSDLKSNQAASVVYTVSGRGNIKYIKLPELNSLYPPELEVYSPTTDIDASVGESNVSGSVKFDYSFMPLEPGSYHIPEVTLVYFNPNSGQYERSVAKGFNINVAKGASSDKSQTRSRLVFDSKLLPVDLKQLDDTHSLWINTVPYWLLYIVPLFALGGAVIGHRRYLAEHADMASFKSRRAGKIARRRLKQAAACLRRNDSAHFYDEMLNALWGYLSDKLKMPASELTRDNVRSEFENRGKADSNLDKLLQLLDECEYAKYAPGADSSANMTQLYDHAAEAIDAVEGSLAISRVSKDTQDEDNALESYIKRK